MQQVTTRGMDTAKNVFPLHGVNGRGKIGLQKRLSRNTVLACIAKRPACLIGLEASGGSPSWARAVTPLGHAVKRMAPQFVKPYMPGHKHAANEAAAIGEAVSRPRMRFVPLQSVAQHEMQALHRIRARQIKRRTALGNQIRGLLSEDGIVMPTGVPQVRQKGPWSLEEADNGVPWEAREWLQSCQAALHLVDAQIAATPERLQQLFAADEACQRLAALRRRGAGRIVPVWRMPTKWPEAPGCSWPERRGIVQPWLRRAKLAEIRAATTRGQGELKMGAGDSDGHDSGRRRRGGNVC